MPKATQPHTYCGTGFICFSKLGLDFKKLLFIQNDLVYKTAVCPAFLQVLQMFAQTLKMQLH